MRIAHFVNFVFELRIPPFILNDVLILSGRPLESTLVTSFPVNSVTSSTHRSAVIDVFLARLLSSLCQVPVCGSVCGTQLRRTDRQRGVEAFTKSCLPQRIRSEQLI